MEKNGKAKFVEYLIKCAWTNGWGNLTIKQLEFLRDNSKNKKIVKRAMEELKEKTK